MNELLRKKECVSLEATKTIREICAPILQDYHLNYFCYGRFYDNGTCILFSNYPDLVDFAFKKKYQMTAPIPKHLLRKKFWYLVPTDTGPYSQVMRDVKTHFNVGSCIDLIDRKQDYYEMFAFGSSLNETKLANFFFNSLGEFENFSYELKSKISALILQSDVNRIHLPHSMLPSFKGLSTQPGEQSQQKIPTSGLKLTNREKECLRYMTLGYTAKETAAALSLSPRTIEFYLENIKSKVGCRKKIDIIYKIMTSERS